MATVKAKRIEVDVAVASDGTASSSQSSDVVHDVEGWTPEHLVLAALCRCSLTALAFHARRDGIGHEAEATARGVVTKDEDGLYRLVETEIDVTVRLDRELSDDDARDLVGRAERGCFVGNSLRLHPTYRWTVNERKIT